MFVNVFVPSLEEILEIFKEVMMELLKGPVLVDPDDSRKIEKSVRLFVNMDNAFGPIAVDTIVAIILLDLF